MLAAYAQAGGREACIVVYDAREGRKLLQEVGRRAGFGARGTGARGSGRGLPARAIPFETFHVAAAGMDFLLGAMAYGASQVCVIAPGLEATGYVAALRQQMGHAQAVADALGYSGARFLVIEPADASELEAALWSLPQADALSVAANFHLSADKRTSLDFAFEHLAKHAPAPKEVFPLPAGAPFGTLAVNRDACTLCKACVGACPEAALQDAQDSPALRFIERNCVQCGLCATTCPEDAIRLVPRLLLGTQAKAAVVLHEAEPFHCVRCGKPFGTRRMIESMTGRLGAHVMFAGGGALRRLQMCADCRVVDMVESADEPSILDYPRGG
jgi:ferredoxin